MSSLSRTGGANRELGKHRRSIFNRLQIGATVVAVLSIALLLAVTMIESWKQSELSLSLAVDTDVAGLADIYASGGESELLSRLDDRTALASMAGRAPHYLLARPDGEILVGDPAAWPAASDGKDTRGFVTMADGTKAYVRTSRLAPDLNLVVAREYQRDRALLVRLAMIFVTIAAAIVISVWLVSRRATDRLRTRVSSISEAFRASEQGDEAPVLSEQSRDEIGELANLSSRSIARVANLARTHRHMSDQIAHEIRTPLTHLDNRLNAAIRSLPDDADPGPLENCRKEIRSIVAMLDSLLDIAASEVRQGDRAGLQEIDLSALASDLVELYTGSAEDAGIHLRSRITNDVKMLGERTQIGRMISNLLDNAIKYVPRGGTITVAISKGPVIEVYDDGPGVDENVKPVLFDRFRKGSTANGKTSHGLGLALVKAIANRHDMDIALVPTKRGAHFSLGPRAASADI